MTEQKFYVLHGQDVRQVVGLSTNQTDADHEQRRLIILENGQTTEDLYYLTNLCDENGDLVDDLPLEQANQQKGDFITFLKKRQTD